MSIGRTAANRDAVTTTTTTGEARELTAAELTGGARPTATAGRRQRRPRRTPSQVSTRSLPTYMREPGDHEVVIYRYVYKRSRSSDISHTIVNEQWPRGYG